MTWLLDPSSAQGVAPARIIGICSSLRAQPSARSSTARSSVVWSHIGAARIGTSRVQRQHAARDPLRPVAARDRDRAVRRDASTELRVDRVAAHPRERIAVTAFRWSWRFEYRGERIRRVGTPDRPPTLYLPLGRATQIDLRSADVTHSFWVPAFLFKRDAIPGMTNVFDLQPTRLGDFPARCAQFCGLDHAHMTFVVRVIPPAAYESLLATRRRRCARDRPGSPRPTTRTSASCTSSRR